MSQPQPPATFYARTFFPEQNRLETAEFAMEPAQEQAQMVCALFLRFLSGRGLEFRERLPFLNHAHVELQWSAAPGGAALASFFHDGEPLSMAILLAGRNAEADAFMLDSLRQTVLEPVLGLEAAAGYLNATERPLLYHLVFPGRPEYEPRAQLLASALASVYFRAIWSIQLEE